MAGAREIENIHGLDPHFDRAEILVSSVGIGRRAHGVSRISGLRDFKRAARSIGVAIADAGPICARRPSGPLRVALAVKARGALHAHLKPAIAVIGEDGDPRISVDFSRFDRNGAGLWFNTDLR
ncbi:MAG: hypothetical protein AAFP78_14615, partial [Pseudomonadota bacterium]